MFPTQIIINFTNKKIKIEYDDENEIVSSSNSHYRLTIPFMMFDTIVSQQYNKIIEGGMNIILITLFQILLLSNSLYGQIYNNKCISEHKRTQHFYNFRWICMFHSGIDSLQSKYQIVY